jgi:hypothetical protein
MIQLYNIPTRPWKVIVTDLCEGPNKTMYSVCVDYYSRYFEVQKLTTTTSVAIVTNMVFLQY